MSYVLTIYSKEIYQDFILPAIDNADYTIVLQQKIFSLSDDVLVRMEIVDGEWRFVQGENYRIVKKCGIYGNSYCCQHISGKRNAVYGCFYNH